MTQNVFNFGQLLEESRAYCSEEELSLIADVVKEMQNLYGPRLQALKLVGSRAPGTAMERSDYDFLVLLDSYNYDVELSSLEELVYQLVLKHGLGCISLDRHVCDPVR